MKLAIALVEVELNSIGVTDEESDIEGTKPEEMVATALLVRLITIGTVTEVALPEYESELASDDTPLGLPVEYEPVTVVMLVKAGGVTTDSVLVMEIAEELDSTLENVATALVLAFALGYGAELKLPLLLGPTDDSEDTDTG